MKTMATALIVGTLASTANAEEKTGFTIDKAPHEHRLTSYKTLDWFKGSLSLFKYQKSETELYGMGMGLSGRVMNYKYMESYISGVANGGVAISDRKDVEPCAPAVIQKYPNKEIVVDSNEQKRKIKQAQADLEYERAKAQVDIDNSIAKSNEDNCNSARKASAEYNRYGGLLFYDVGLESAYKLSVFRIVTFAGYRFEHKKSWNNRGDIDLEGFTYKIGVGFEW